MMIRRVLPMLLLLAGFFTSCVKPVQETRIALSHTEMTLYVGEDSLLTAEVVPGDFEGEIRWESLKPDIVSVSEDGLITALAVGNTQVTASVDGLKEGCRVTVLPIPVPVDSVSLSRKILKLVVGRTDSLTCFIYPSDADSSRVVWTLSDSLVAQVDDGKVKALVEGTTYVKATVDGKSDSCKVNVVTTIPVESISLDVTSRKMELGDSFRINATLTPEDAVDKTVSWSSSDESVAIVSKDGKVTAVGVGKAAIVATAVNGGVNAECVVDVTISVKSVSLDVASKEIHEGRDFLLTAKVLPENAVNRNVVWTSSDESVATVDAGHVFAVSAGQAVITVTTVDGNHTATCAVNVLSATKPVAGVVLDVPEEISMKVGQVLPVSATVLPEDARNVNVFWESSDLDGEVVALLPGTLKSQINVKAVGNGEATVSVVTEDGGFRKEVKITIDSSISENEGFVSGDIEWD